jgi:hypothetical protein
MWSVDKAEYVAGPKRRWLVREVPSEVVPKSKSPTSEGREKAKNENDIQKSMLYSMDRKK